jgi:hypothetical protein
MLVLNYQLIEEPLINTNALPPEHRSSCAQWMYDEIGWERDYATHTILFSNGWEVELHLRDLQVIAAQTLIPLLSTPPAPAAAHRV